MATDLTFNVNLKNEGTAEYMALKNQILTPLQNAICGSTPDCSVLISSFSEGSVIINYLIAIATGDATCEDRQTLLNNLQASLPTIVGGINITPGSFSTGKSVLIKTRPKKGNMFKYWQ